MDLTTAVIVILSVWSAVLLWASWQIGVMLRTLALERQELRRWLRLKNIYDGQRSRWQ